MLQLEFPDKKHQSSYEDLLHEWSTSEKIPTSPWKLFDGQTFEEFIAIVKNDVANNLNWVNSHLYFLTEGKEILWAIHIRHHIEHPNLKEKWWHIWYGIAPKYRWNGYASQMLALALQEAKKLGLTKLLLTCDRDNIPSNKVILNNGWVFERVTEDGTANRYWIDIE